MGPLGTQGEGKEGSTCSGVPRREEGDRFVLLLAQHVTSDTGPSTEGSASKRTHRLHSPLLLSVIGNWGTRGGAAGR